MSNVRCRVGRFRVKTENRQKKIEKTDFFNVIATVTFLIIKLGHRYTGCA